MRIEDQICSLELAKKLKELGVEQDSLYAYVNSEFGIINNEKYENKIILTHQQVSNSNHKWSAFTVAELGEMLPDNLCIEGNSHPFLLIGKGNREENKWTIGYSTMKACLTPLYTESNEANARAKMIIYLIENGLIKKENL